MAPAAVAPAGQALAGSRVTPRVMTAAARTGLRLMSEAAAACQSVAFHGYQMAAWWGPDSAGAAVVQLWHRPGGEILGRSSNTASDPASTRQAGPAAALDQSQIMTVTPALLALMRRNYLIDLRPARAPSTGGPRSQIAISSPGGSVAAVFWLDAATKLPLRRELFDSSGQIFSEDAFIGVSFGAGQLDGMPAAAGQPWTGQADRGRPGSPAGLRLAACRGRQSAGWPCSAPLIPPQVPAKSSNSPIPTDSRSSRYSSQRGELPKSLPGWRRIAARGRDAVYAIDPDDRTLTWSARGFVYTMISDAAPGTVDQALSQLPHDSPAGFWERMGRGFGRMVSWANPFG